MRPPRPAARRTPGPSWTPSSSRPGERAGRSCWRRSARRTTTCGSGARAAVAELQQSPELPGPAACARGAGPGGARARCGPQPRILPAGSSPSPGRVERCFTLPALVEALLETRRDRRGGAVAAVTGRVVRVSGSLVQVEGLPGVAMNDIVTLGAARAVRGGGRPGEADWSPCRPTRRPVVSPRCAGDGHRRAALGRPRAVASRRDLRRAAPPARQPGGLAAPGSESGAAERAHLGLHPELPSRAALSQQGRRAGHAGCRRRRCRCGCWCRRSSPEGSPSSRPRAPTRRTPCWPGWRGCRWG